MNAESTLALELHGDDRATAAPAAPVDGSSDVYTARTACLPPSSSVRAVAPPPRTQSGTPQLVRSEGAFPAPPLLPCDGLDDLAAFEELLDRNIACEPAPPSQPLELVPVSAILNKLLGGVKGR